MLANYEYDSGNVPGHDQFALQNVLSGWMDYNFTQHGSDF